MTFILTLVAKTEENKGTAKYKRNIELRLRTVNVNEAGNNGFVCLPMMHCKVAGANELLQTVIKQLINGSVHRAATDMRKVGLRMIPPYHLYE